VVIHRSSWIIFFLSAFVNNESVTLRVRKGCVCVSTTLSLLKVEKIPEIFVSSFVFPILKEEIPKFILKTQKEEFTIEGI
jgi:hypothetical protein